MTKAQFAAKLAERWKTPKAQAVRTLDDVIDQLTVTLKKGDRVRFPGFRHIPCAEAQGTDRAQPADW
jgi:nucleoid DNA-binding protein